MLENGMTECNCKKKKCIRFGKCKECMEYHQTKETLPYCKRPKKNKLFGFKKA